MIITLNGLTGVGKGTVGEILAQQLCSEWITARDLFLAEAKSRKISPAELEKLAATDPSVDRVIDARIRKLGQKDRIIFDSRLGWHFLPKSYKVLLVCSFPDRIRWIAKRQEISFEEAYALTVDREKSITSRYFDAYKIEVADLNFGSEKSELFDLVIDTTDLSPDQIVERIRAKVGS